MTQDEIEEMAELSGLYLYKTNEELIYCLTYFAKLVAEKAKQEQGEPMAYMSSTKNNHLVNKAQYDSMEEKNREHFDIPLYDKPQPKQNQSEPLGYLRQVGCSENPPHGWAFYFSSGEIPVYTTPQQRTWVGLDWLPEHKCGLHLSHNEHRDVYETVEQFYDVDDFISTGEWHKAVAEDSVWVLHWYPNTPIGFTRIAASTLEAIEAKLKENI